MSYLRQAFLQRLTQSNRNVSPKLLQPYRFITSVSTKYADRSGNLETNSGLLPELPDDHKLKIPKKTLIRECTLVMRNDVILPRVEKSELFESEDEQVHSINPEKHSEKTNIPKLILADGFNGVGKSSLTAQTVSTARASGYIVLYIPNALDWIHGEGFYSATAVDGHNPALEGIPAIRWYDRPTQTLNLLRSFLQAHEEQLTRMQVHEEFTVDTTQHCTTIRDLVETGITFVEDIDSNWQLNPKRAGDVLNHLIMELCFSENPVAIVIDNYESLIGMTCMMDARKRRMHANSIRVIAQHLGRDAIEETASKMRNGFVMVTTQSKPSLEEWRKSRVRSSVDFPLSEEILNDPSGEKWLNMFKERVSSEEQLDKLYINVPELTSNELKAVCATFAPRGLREEPRGGDQRSEIERMIALSGGRAHTMKRIFESR